MYLTSMPEIYHHFSQFAMTNVGFLKGLTIFFFYKQPLECYLLIDNT